MSVDVEHFVLSVQCFMTVGWLSLGLAACTDWVAA